MFQNSIKRNFDAVSDMAGASFSNYDPDNSSNFEDQMFNTFDFTGSRLMGAGTAVKATGSTPRRSQQPATFNLKIKCDNGGGTVADHAFELFNYQNTIANYTNNSTNPNLVPLGGARNNQVRDQAGTGIAQLFAYGALGVDPGNASKDMVYWSDIGDLVYNYNVATSDTLVISCKEIPYRSLFTYMGQYSMHVNKMRITYGQDVQISQDFVLTYKNFLGTVKNSTISPSTYKTPTQFQNLIVDLPTPFSINSERGMQSTLLGGATSVSYMNITFFVDKYTVPVL